MTWETRGGDREIDEKTGQKKKLSITVKQEKSLLRGRRRYNFSSEENHEGGLNYFKLIPDVWEKQLKRVFLHWPFNSL